VIPLATQHYMPLQRNLIYTGITRGKRLLALIVQKNALGIAVRNDRPLRRYSGLLASLRGDKGGWYRKRSQRTSGMPMNLPNAIP
jgi:exodeoxyribonuclease V alpha subunit